MSPGQDVGVGELRAALTRRLEEIETELREADALRDRHTAERRKLELARGRALGAAAAAILPALDDASRARAVRLSGFTPLRQEDPRAAIERERQELLARLGEIEADPRHRDRELLRAPRVGTLTRQIDELEEFRASLSAIVDAAAHPRLERLLQTGYGTEAYDVGWWRASYYLDWKAGDEILEKLPGKTFAEVREELLRARDSLAVYDQKLGFLRDEIALGEALEREHAAATERLANLEQHHLQAWRERLAEHLSSLDPQALGDRLAGEPDVELLLKQALGLERKLAYLDEIVEKQAAPLRQALAEERRKIGRDLAKYSRPKNAHARVPRDKFERRFHERPAKLRKGLSRAGHSYETVHHFDRWDRGRLVEDFLWWDVMTDGRLDGDFIPEVRRFHQAHPDWEPASRAQLGEDDERAAAAAALAQDTRDDGNLLVDAS